MKKNVLLTLLVSVMLFSIAKSQDCFKYFPQKEGQKLEVTHYDKKDKVTSKTIQMVVKKSKVDGNEQIDMKQEVIPENSDSVFVNEYSIVCDGDKIYVDMENYLSQEQMSPYQQMDVEIDAENLDIPMNPKAGQKLSDGKVVAKAQNDMGVTMVTISVEVSNRKVEKFETVKTPAGTFECFKVTQDILSKVGFIKVRSKSAEWYAPKYGIVKSEAYNKRGKLTGYSVLTKID